MLEARCGLAPESKSRSRDSLTLESQLFLEVQFAVISEMAKQMQPLLLVLAELHFLSLLPANQSEAQNPQLSKASAQTTPESCSQNMETHLSESHRIDSRSTQQDEHVKAANWKVENMRHKHNYIPFLLKFLKILAEKGQLGDLVEAAKEKQNA